MPNTHFRRRTSNWSSLVVIGVALAVACAHTSTRVEPPSVEGSAHVSVPAASVAPARAVVSPAEPELDPRMEAKLVEWNRVHDWRNTVFIQGSLASVKQAVPTKGKFPYAQIATARAYTFDHVPSLHGLCGYKGRADTSDEGEPPSVALPFARDGSLCPNVVLPVAELSPEQLALTLELIRAADNKKSHSSPRLRCDFEPRHAIAFFDTKGFVVAKLIACFTCGEVQTFPGVEGLGGDNPGLPREEGALHTLGQLFDRLGLASWVNSDAGREEYSGYLEKVYGPAGARTQRGMQADAQLASKGSGLDPERPVGSLTNAERERLCLWFREASYELSRQRNFQENEGWGCESGRSLSYQRAPRCAPVPPTCTASVQRVEACLKALSQTRERICASSLDECREVSACLPGIVVRDPSWSRLPDSPAKSNFALRSEFSGR